MAILGLGSRMEFRICERRTQSPGRQQRVAAFVRLALRHGLCRASFCAAGGCEL